MEKKRREDFACISENRLYSTRNRSNDRSSFTGPLVRSFARSSDNSGINDAFSNEKDE